MAGRTERPHRVTRGGQKKLPGADAGDLATAQGRRPLMHRLCPSSRIPVPPATREMALITRGAWPHIWGRQACPPLTANHSSLQPGCFAFTAFREKKKSGCLLADIHPCGCGTILEQPPPPPPLHPQPSHQGPHHLGWSGLSFGPLGLRPKMALQDAPTNITPPKSQKRNTRLSLMLVGKHFR